MSYGSVIDELRQKDLEQRAQAFAAAYDPALPSVILLPGGMGSRLIRSTVPYSLGTPFTNTQFYELWLDFYPAVQGELKHIAMNAYGEDQSRHPLVASGELSSIVKKYDGVRAFFAGKANFAGLGYDWRRAPDREFTYVRSFLRRVADKVMARGHADPRRRLTLFAHSQGGLVAKFFLNDVVERGEKVADWCERTITCCSPFYGTWTHLSRYYVGETFPNIVTGGADVVSRIVASLKGPYILLPAPRAVLAPRLAALGLARYPVRDAADDAIECDAFDPAMRARLPAYVSTDHLVAARNQFAQIDAPLPAAATARLFHIRSRGPEGADQPFEMQWRADAGGGDPVDHNAGGLHDGTVPFWAARLATTPDSNVFDVACVPHGGAAENPTVLDIVWRLVRGIAVAPGLQATTAGPHYGSDILVETALRQVKAGTRPPQDLMTLPPDHFRTLVDGFTLG